MVCEEGERKVVSGLERGVACSLVLLGILINRWFTICDMTEESSFTHEYKTFTILVKVIYNLNSRAAINIISDDMMIRERDYCIRLVQASNVFEDLLDT